MDFNKSVRALRSLPLAVQVIIVLGIVVMLVLVLVCPTAAAALTSVLLTLKTVFGKSEASNS